MQTTSQPDLLPPDGIATKQMKVFFDVSSDAITPLFQVEDGICQDSLGIQCAVAMGLPEEFTNRAEEVGRGSEWEQDLQGNSHR